MAEQKSESSEDRPEEPARDEAADTGRVEHKGFDLQPGEGRMSGARTGRSGGAQEDPGGQYSGFTPEGRSGM